MAGLFWAWTAPPRTAATGQTASDRHAKPAKRAAEKRFPTTAPHTQHQAGCTVSHPDCPSRQACLHRRASATSRCCPARSSMRQTEISSSCGGAACSAAQGRRAAKWGKAAGSLPMAVWVRLPVALAGDGNPSTPNQRLPVAPQRGAWPSRHEPPRAARRRELSQAAATTVSVAPPTSCLL